MSEWKEDAIRHKYDPLPEEPRHRKKAKKRHVRSDHKHDYEAVCIDDGAYYLYHGEKYIYYNIGKRCRICGKLNDFQMKHDLHEPPEGMPLYKVNDFWELWNTKVLLEEMRVR